MKVLVIIVEQSDVEVKNIKSRKKGKGAIGAMHMARRC